MKTICLKICIFMSIALLLFNASDVFAYDTLDEALDAVTGNMEIVGFEEVLPESETGGEKIPVNQYYYYRFDDDIFKKSEDGTVTVGGKKYKVGIGLVDADGVGIIPITDGIVYNEDAGDDVGTGAYASRIKSSVKYGGKYINPKDDFSGKEIVCYLTPVDGDGEIVCQKDIGKFKLPSKMIQFYGEERMSLKWYEKAWVGIKMAITKETGDAKKILTQSIVSILLPCGDAFLHMLSIGVGELVTIDRIVFGEVDKLSIDFFDDFSENYYKKDLDLGNDLLNNMVDKIIEQKEQSTLRAPLKPVINMWYAFFLKIAILFYMALLVYMGFRIILASTGAKKAEYKTRLTAWTMGVAMLLCFPYVMKYTIQANQALCQWIGDEITDSQAGTAKGTEYNIAEKDVITLAPDYGKYSFLAKAMGYNNFKSFAANSFGGNLFGNNIMLKVRFDALMNYSIPLSIVYLIMIGQTMALVILYYKRVFMMAFLITIFPLTAMFYTLNKTGDLKINSFGAWFKEFAVNVFVQAFHAVTYVTIVTIGITAYQDNGDWMFFILCVLFLFDGEKIIRAIFNAQSPAGTIGDMAAAGAMAWGILKKAASALPKGKDEKDDDEKDDGETKKDKVKGKAKGDVEKANQQVNRNTPTQGAEKNKAATVAAAKGSGKNGASGSQGSGASNGESSDKTEIKLGREPNTSHEEIFNKVNKRIEESASDVSKPIKFLAGAGTGVAKSLVSYTFAAAQTKDFRSAGAAVGVGISGATSGFESGQKVVESVHNYRQNKKMRAAGLVLADEYMNGEHDDDFVINEADEQLRKVKLETYRKIAARVARERAKYGKDAAEKVIINEMLDTK